MSLNRDLEFLFEMSMLRFRNRTWDQFLGQDFQNLSEHIFHVMWIAMVLAKYEKDVDTEKVLKMALVHDIPESRAGDVNYLTRLYSTRNEELAIEDMLADTKLAPEFIDLWHEYEKRECIEAKIVKDADNIAVDMELQEREANGSSIKQTFLPNREKAVYPKLYTETAKKFWKAIYEANPHAWHMNARNRFNSGDWKQEKK